MCYFISNIHLSEILKDYQTIIASIFAAYIAYRFNSSKYKLDKEVAKRELFTKLNERYDKLNDYLEKLVHSEFETTMDAEFNGERSLDMIWEDLFESEPNLKSKNITAVFDYINLCSEQYYWYRKGFIDENVWQCWKKGMQDWYRHSFFIKKLIEREKERNASYYNHDFLDIFKDIK